MTALTRRNVLRSASAAVAVVAVAAPAAIALAETVGSSDPAIAAAAHWHRAFDRALELAEWLVSHQNLHDGPDLDREEGVAREYAEWHKALRTAGQAVSDAREQLLAEAPRTVAGAVAILGCASRVMMEQRRARQDMCAAGTRARIVFCVLDNHGQEAMVLAAQPVLERLAEEARS
jgi:hypothetical protein